MNMNKETLMYKYFEKVKEAYYLLSDEESKEIFLARIQMDIAPNLKNMRKLASFYVHTGAERTDQKFIEGIEQDLINTALVAKAHVDKGDKIVIYGAKNWGVKVAETLTNNNIDIYGFVCRNSDRYKDGVNGIPVFGSEWLADHKNEVFIVIAISNFNGLYDEVRSILNSMGFPDERIIQTTQHLNMSTGGKGQPVQYFDFTQFIPEQTAFLDCGCYDGGTSILFSHYCPNYSRILAFEPVPELYEKCVKSTGAAHLRDTEVLPYAVSDKEDISDILKVVNGGSRLVSAELKGIGGNEQYIKCVKIDDIVGDERVGFIKMDIEGAEYAALRGAESIIKRDKPLLAICVYHKPGDTIAIFDLLREFVPEYCFWLRHYSYEGGETVLYAAVCEV